ncbi:hypothetical protein OU798_02665 [Prolixibacteraceae bacterium Z1-6]|uniref:Uncharacterized protein n=1 Tax=Draconibacterium aestuarii TaxID=2998507 RepID=A0A9X3F2L3_9BACT|nr:hypothetical protein [Prolixibacteraceae bacterium Z1-6]
MKDLLFKDIVRWLTNDLRQESWTTVYKDLDLETDWFRICGILVPKDLKSKFLEHGEWSLNTTQFKPDFVHYADEDPKYFRWGIDLGYEPLIYQRFYNNIYPTTYEIIEEFKLYFNLYFDSKSNTYIAVDDYSNENTIIVKTPNEIKIRTSSLREFLSAKKMSLGLQLDYFRFSSLEFETHNLNEDDYFENVGKDFCYNITFQKSDYFNEEAKKINSRLLAKKIISDFSKFKPKHWTDKFENKEYCDFIISEDIDTGQVITNTCNPDKLADFFGKNPDSPQFLTSIFFKREVLLKYYQDTKKYTVSDGTLFYKGSWHLEIDNNHPNAILVYLGDLGRNLPYEEQLYWRSFNIPPNGYMSEVKFNRDFLSISNPPRSLDLIFKSKFKTFKINWLEKFGFSLFNELAEKDYHCLKSIRLPLYEDNSEFDNLILNLTKILIDYINEKELNKRIKTTDKNVQGIGKLELFLKETYPSPQNVIPFLRQLQRLRSKGSAHRKGKDYLTILKELGIENKTYLESFEIILKKAIKAIDELNEIEHDV